ncbi:MAG: hypothetical protein ABIA21_00580 [Candidatus Aenigmatarchaeota archaeon]
MDCEMEIKVFNVVGSFFIKEQKEVHKDIKNSRRGAWQKALKESGGDKQKALVILKNSRKLSD